MNTYILEERVSRISTLFDTMNGTNASNWQIVQVQKFRMEYPELESDLNFSFEVLAGMHKLGVTLKLLAERLLTTPYEADTIEQLIQMIKDDLEHDKSDARIHFVCSKIPVRQYSFMTRLLNRDYRLGYSNKSNMITDKHCMLAKSYPDHLRQSGEYYVQEKLNGNRCIAYYDYPTKSWKFVSRSQKPLNVNFDMSYMDKDYIYDGEIMTRNKMGNKDFAETSGIINSKSGDKSQLMYYIYDILHEGLSFHDRYGILSMYKEVVEYTTNVRILKILAFTYVSTNIADNEILDTLLDRIVARGGEGIMLRPYGGVYEHKRSNNLLKYKKTKTADLRIVGFNEGKGKYEGAIGSFICEDDEQTISVSVAGISDDIRWSDPSDYIGMIVEVAYFETSQSKNKSTGSLQFPRMKGFRPDKDDTSLF